MLTWTDLAFKEFECEKDESGLVTGKDSYNFLTKNNKKKKNTHFLSALYRLAYKRFLGDLAVMFVCQMGSIFYSHKSLLSTCA